MKKGENRWLYLGGIIIGVILGLIAIGIVNVADGGSLDEIIGVFMLSGFVFIIATPPFDCAKKGFLFGVISFITGVLFIWFLKDIFLSAWLLIVLIVVIGEGLFWIDKELPGEKDNKFWFTIVNKIDALFSVLIAAIVVIGGVNLIEKLTQVVIEHKAGIAKWIGIIGMGVVGLGIVVLLLWGYIKLNSLKYRGKGK